MNYNKNDMQARRFIGRAHELERLEEAFESERAQLWVIYGRRRVGKTSLIRQFVRGRPTFFFTGGRERARKQTQRFMGTLAELTGQPALERIPAPSWSEALGFLDQHLSKTSEKTVVVFDEFQWMCRGASSVLSDLQRLWDHDWKDSRRVHLILCGSAVSFMVGEVLAQKSPLFGRRTGTIHLEPLDAGESRGFFPGRGIFEVAEALICLGGVPAYLELLQDAPSVRQGLDRLAFRRDGYLVDEIDHVFGEQLREKERYYQIAELLAERPASVTELSKATGLNKGQLDFYLQRLLALRFIDKHRPITAARTSRTVRHRLRDEYIRFYFTFVAPHLARIRLNRRGYHFDQLTAGRYEPFLGLGFERFVHRNLEALLQTIDARERVTRVGSYWHGKTARRPGVQIDLVVERDDGVTNIVECKWSRSRIGRSVVDELMQKCQLYPNPRKHTLEPVLVAANGATRGVRDAGIKTVTLKDLFAEPHTMDSTPRGC
jgi:AAA+ ATPase superfamily predicted ATPase